jgi:hypothetical protein
MFALGRQGVVAPPQVNAVAVRTSATLPLVALIGMPLPAPVASGAGSGVGPPAPAAC